MAMDYDSWKTECPEDEEEDEGGFLSDAWLEKADEEYERERDEQS